jgi:cytochrome c6
MGAKDLAAASGSEADIAATIANGKGKMSAYKDKLSDAEIRALAKYVKAGVK